MYYRKEGAFDGIGSSFLTNCVVLLQTCLTLVGKAAIGNKQKPCILLHPSK